MKSFCLSCCAFALLAVDNCSGGEVLFADDFKGKLGEGWSWVREHRDAWRVSEHGLEVRIEPGNMWGPANDAKNVLVRPAPEVTKGQLEISASVTNRPTGRTSKLISSGITTTATW